jgi:hypothetical protein
VTCRLRHRRPGRERPPRSARHHRGYQRVEQQARRALEGITDFEAVTDPVERLQLLAGRAERFMEVIGAKVEELNAIRYSSEAGEQLRAEIGIYERAMVAAGRLLTDLAKLGLNERAVRVSERMASLLNGVILGVLADAGLSEELRAAVRPAIALRLRLVAAELGTREVEPTAGIMRREPAVLHGGVGEEA